jgi:membrane fusion protein (multidrug efflux system)
MATTYNGRPVTGTAATSNAAAPNVAAPNAAVTVPAEVPHEAAEMHPQPDNAQAAESRPPGSPAQAKPSHKRKMLRWGAVAAGLAVVVYFLIPWIAVMLSTVSTDDAYVNGHVTFVAARVPGQVSRVLVDDNMRVKKGDLLVQLDKEPYQVQFDLQKAKVETAKAQLWAAQAQAHAQAGNARSKRFMLEHAIEDVNNKVALLRANIASFETYLAQRARAKADFDRAKELMKTPGAISQQEFDLRLQDFQVAKAQVKQGLEAVYQVRVSLGLPVSPVKDVDITKAPPGLDQVPPDLDQNYSTVRQALGELMLSTAQLGYFTASWDATPKKTIETFYKQDQKEDINAILAKIIRDAPIVKEAQAKLLQAERDLEQAALNLRYTDVVAEIDGVVTRRNVNPGNNVIAGQGLMAVRSVTEIWIDANFKETQLADLRIGQRVKIEVDMYGSRKEYEGRISGFTFGTGQTLAILPPQNATGNFVKIVQRLPVRIELTDYDPKTSPLFVGLSVTPYVYFKEAPAGPHAGDVLQPYQDLPPE